VNLLLDTHTLIWLLSEPERLSDVALERVEDTANTVYVSVISIWEIGIKTSKGKFRSPPDLDRALERQRFQTLPVTLRHARAVEALPDHHGDPFDRMLICQAQLDDLTLITSDRTMRRYPVAVLPAS
jgi:PIN domain nuclease of toxin-antitoxin system